jgi:hypothetical protein
MRILPKPKKPVVIPPKPIVKPIVKVTTTTTTTTTMAPVPTTTQEPVKPVPTKAPREYMPIHVNDCVRTNTALVEVIQHDRSVGKVVEVFRSDLVESRPIYIRVKFHGEHGATPFAFSEVVKVDCVPNGWPKETWVRPSDNSEETGATGSMTGSEETGMTGGEATGATGGEATGATGATAGEETGMTAGEETRMIKETKMITGPENGMTGGDETGMTGGDETGITGMTGEEDTTSATNVMKKLIEKKIVNADVAAENSNEQLTIRRAERYAFKMAVQYLRAARHRDVVFVRAVKTGTHVMGFSRMIEQVKKLKAGARLSRNVFVETLERFYADKSERVQTYLKQLDDKTKRELKQAHPEAAAAFDTEECRTAERLFKSCPRGFGCTNANGDCRKCGDCDLEESDF